MVQHLEKYGDDAETAVFVNCDEEGCELVEGQHDRDGWHFQSKGETSADQESHMIMMRMEDTE